ncbi:MAG: hypothetical protein V2A56_05015 [bacterium]
MVSGGDAADRGVWVMLGALKKEKVAKIFPNSLKSPLSIMLVMARTELTLLTLPSMIDSAKSAWSAGERSLNDTTVFSLSVGFLFLSHPVTNIKVAVKTKTNANTGTNDNFLMGNFLSFDLLPSLNLKRQFNPSNK